MLGGQHPLEVSSSLLPSCATEEGREGSSVLEASVSAGSCTPVLRPCVSVWEVSTCSLEFVGRHEPTGWKLAERLTPITYIAWSAWLVATGIALLA
jgi:hypothetical protein